MKRIKNNCIFIFFLFLCSIALVSCKDDDNEIEETLPRVIEELPSAENVKSTSAYIPVNENAHVELRVGFDEKNVINPTEYMIMSLFLNREAGFELKGLEPSRTYYYTMVYHKSNKYLEEVFSKQVKSFTTQGVSIEFIGQGERNSLRVKIHAADEEDADSYSLHVTFYSVNGNGEVEGVFNKTNHIGGGIWEQEYFRPFEGDSWKAAVISNSGSAVAETPIYTFVNGEWKAK